MNTIAFKQLLLEKGITQKKIAQQLSIDQKTLSEKVLGKNDFWARELFKMADILDISSIEQLRRIFE